MSNFKIKIDTKKLEKSINNQLESIVQKKQQELILKQKMRGSNEGMNILPSKEEELLEIIINKYDGNAEMKVEGNWDDIPNNIKIGIKDAFNTLNLYNYIGKPYVWLSGNWFTTINKEAFEYFEKKGMRKELFEELSEEEKELLKEIIDTEINGEDISQLLADRVEKDKNDLVRGIIGSLKKNGLINVNWADDTVCNACLNNAGRTYFEREEKYFNRMKEKAHNTYNFGNIYADSSNIVMGNVINSTLNIDNHVSQIDKQIDEKASEEDKEALKEIVKEAKEIIDNIKANGVVEKRKSFFKKLTDHANKYGWFYAEVVNLIGTAVLTKIGG